MIRALALLLLSSATASAWVESVEFPWNALPRETWEPRLVWLKEIGITRVALPAGDLARMEELARLLKRLDLEAELEGPMPAALEPYRRSHAGPFADPMPGTSRLSATAQDALPRARRLLSTGKPGLVWADAFDTLGPSGYKAGAVGFSGQERAGALALRRSAQLSRYWGAAMSTLSPAPGAAAKIPSEVLSVQQFASAKGVSFVAAANSGARPWMGDLRAIGPQRRVVNLPAVTIPPHDALWLPVNVPLMAGPLCKDCTAFATVDRLVYATTELTAMEYENGVLAMEFSSPNGGEALLQLSREPSGPYVAGGHPNSADWDEKTKTVRLSIPRGTGRANRVRVALAIEAPDQTAFFDDVHVLLIGEENRLPVKFSSEAIAQRSRLRTVPTFQAAEDAGPDGSKSALQTVYRVQVPASAIPGDWADLSLEADGSRMSHFRPVLLRPVELRFTDAISVRVATSANLPLTPAAIPVNQRGGRDLGIEVRNNAPAIRTFVVRMEADGLEFSPDHIQVTVGASTQREVSFRVFTRGAVSGVHNGRAVVGGDASTETPVRFLVVPPNGAVAYSANGFSFLESAKTRASFLPGRWLEWINKDNGQNAIPAGGNAFAPGAIDIRPDALVVGGQKSIRLQDLESLVPVPKR